MQGCRRFLTMARVLVVTGCVGFVGCAESDLDSDDPVIDSATHAGHDHSRDGGELLTAEQAITAADLSTRILGRSFPVSWPFSPGTHAGIDFGGITNNVTRVVSPIAGRVVANTSACGKVAIFDGRNTHIFAHMSNRGTFAVGSTIPVGTYLGTTSNVVGGGCSATAAHLHYEIRTGENPSMALPSTNNGTILNPLTYSYPAADTTPPSISISSPATGATLVRGTSYTLRWTASDASGVSRVSADIISGTATTCVGATSRSAVLADSTYTTSTVWRVPTTLAAGSYRLKIAVRDTAGNWGCVMRSVTIR